MKKKILKDIEKQAGEDFADGMHQVDVLYEWVKDGHDVTPEVKMEIVRAFMFSVEVGEATDILIEMRRARRGF